MGAALPRSFRKMAHRHRNQPLCRVIHPPVSAITPVRACAPLQEYAPYRLWLGNSVIYVALYLFAARHIAQGLCGRKLDSRQANCFFVFEVFAINITLSFFLIAFTTTVSSVDCLVINCE